MYDITKKADRDKIREFSGTESVADFPSEFWEALDYIESLERRIKLLYTLMETAD